MKSPCKFSKVAGMWKILDAEFRYHAVVVVITCAVSVSFVVAMAFSGSLKDNDSTSAASLMSTIMVAYIYLLIHIGGCQEQEKRDRLHASLPVSLPKLGLIRWLHLVLLQAGFAAITLLGVLLADKFDRPSLFQVISSNAFIFQVVALIALYLELGYFGSQKYRRILLTVLLVVAALIVWLIRTDRILDVLRNLFEPYTTLGGAAIFCALAAGLLLLNVVVFTRRQTYLS